MKGSYNKIRFTLFVRSYPGYFLINRLRNKYEDNQKLAEREITKLTKVLSLNKKWLKLFIFKNRLPKGFLVKGLIFFLQDKHQIPIFLQIEKEVINLALDKQNRNPLMDYEYERALLAPAIERVAGNRLSKVKDDFEFDNKLPELSSKYEYLYYQVIYRYKLPSLRNLSFVLRLVRVSYKFYACGKTRNI